MVILTNLHVATQAVAGRDESAILFKRKHTCSRRPTSPIWRKQAAANQESDLVHEKSDDPACLLPVLSPAYYLDHDDHAPPSFQWQSWSIDPIAHGPMCLLYWVHPYLRQRSLFSCNTLIYCHKSNKRIPTSIIGGKNTIFMQQLSFLLQYRQIYCNARNYLMQHNKFVAISFTTRNRFEFCANNPYLLQRK